MGRPRICRTRMIWPIIALVVAGCETPAPQGCPAGLKPVTEAELFFGRDIAGGGSVGDAEWQSFLDTDVTPRFPNGLTVEDGSGQWKDEHGIVRESSKRVTIVLTGAPGEQADLDAIRASYKSRFRQDAVLLVETNGCGGF